MTRRFLLLGACMLPGLAGTIFAGDDALEPPFGLVWGDPPARLVQWARESKLDQVVREPGDNRRMAILMISAREGNLPGHDATTVEARFIDGRLFEVALHYNYPGRRSTFVKGKFERLRRILSARHGALTPNGKMQRNRDGIVATSEAFQVKPGAGRLLLLAITEVRDAKRGDSAARFSVVYHNDEVLLEDLRQAELNPSIEIVPDSEAVPK